MILSELHPATVVLPSGETLQRVKVALTHKRVRVWQDVGGQVTLVVDSAHDGVTLRWRHPPVGKGFTVPTADGTLEVTRLAGCGCGSPLKAVKAPAD